MGTLGNLARCRASPVTSGYDVIVSLKASPCCQEKSHAFVLYLSTASARPLPPGRDLGEGVLDPGGQIPWPVGWSQGLCPEGVLEGKHS